MDLLLLLSLAAAAVPAPAPEVRPLVVGHRGARARFPENTVPAVRHALAAGARGVEVDVRVSSDDVLVVTHDATLPPERCRAPGGRRVPPGLAIRGLSFDALRRFDCGAVADPRFPAQRPVPGTRIPSLDEVLELLSSPEPPAARDATLFLELKREEAPSLSPPVGPYAHLVVEALARRGLTGRTIVLSFDYPLLRAVRALQPSLPAMLLVDHETDLAALALREGAAWVGPRHTRLTAASVEALHAAGVRVFAWTANSPADQDRLAAMGVDAIGTDDPAGLLARWASPAHAGPSARAAQDERPSTIEDRVPSPAYRTAGRAPPRLVARPREEPSLPRRRGP
jgi:glycerophosphoryl diester phosphodiesterase